MKLIDIEVLLNALDRLEEKHPNVLFKYETIRTFLEQCPEAVPVNPDIEKLL